MRKKIFMLGLSICLLATACSSNDVPKDHVSENTEDSGNMEENSDSESKGGTGNQEDKENSPKEQPASEKEKQQNNTVQKDITKVPEVTFTDYSQNIEEDGVLMLAVTENCPVITVEESEDIAQRMNMVFEQQHVTNQGEIQRKAEEAKAFYKGLPKEEVSSWGGYGYGMSYKMMYASTKILSIESESYDWQGASQPNKWTSSYCFDVTTGDLLSLVDVFTDEQAVRLIVSEHIKDTITKEPYKDALLDDYESYVDDVMTENTFYLNDKGLVVICNPFMVTGGAAGTIEVEIPYKKIKDRMNPKYVPN